MKLSPSADRHSWGWWVRPNGPSAGRYEQPIAGRYELVERVGPGGMGQVWRGYDAMLDREVAVKLIRTDVIASAEEAEEFAKRFRREARITARIQHHGVPQIYDAVLDQPYDQVFLVMEYVRGAGLRAYIDPRRPLPIPWAIAVAAQICTVLSHAHAIPVVHRDLKPENIMVTEAGAVKVLDFGIAAILRTDVTRLTATGQLLGTHRYMPPEQVRGGQITPHSDLYAVGCLLHELLAGTPIFDGATAFALMHQHVSAAPVPLRQLRADVPADVERLVLALTAKQPEQRPRDAYEVYERLLPFLPMPDAAPPNRMPSDGPPPGSDVPGSPDWPAIPDPTLLYRRPNSPRPSADSPSADSPSADSPSVLVGPFSSAGTSSDVAPGATPQSSDVTRGPSAGVPGTVLPGTVLRAAIDDAIRRSDDLLAHERYAQAAAVLQQVITPAATALGLENPHVLRLRQRRAAILVLGGDFRAALPEFDALTAAFAQAQGVNSASAVACVRQAAHCRAELGQATVALRQFRQVLTHLRAVEGDVSPDVLALRRDIIMLLLTERDITAARAELTPLYEDLRLVYGPGHEETREIGDILARLRLRQA